MRRRMQGLLCLVAALLLCAGCRAPSTIGYFSYRETAFCAELCGKLRGVPFLARGTVEPRENVYLVTLVFFEMPKGEPSSPLAGITVRAELSREGRPRGSAELICLNVKAETDGEHVAFLLLPLSLLLAPTEFSSVQRVAEGYRLCFSDGSEWLLDGEMRPREVHAAEVSFTVAWWEIKF